MNSSSDLLLSLYSHREFCVNYLIKQTSCDKDDAENIFIESVLDLQEKNINFSEIKNMKSYLVITSLNHWRRLYTKAKKQNESRNQIEMYFYHYLPHRKLDDANGDFSERRYQIANQAFEQLSEKCRSIISQFYLENKTMSEIADKLGFNTSLVATTVKYRCLNRLKKFVFEIDNKKNK